MREDMHGWSGLMGRVFLAHEVWGETDWWVRRDKQEPDNEGLNCHAKESTLIG